MSGTTNIPGVCVIVKRGSEILTILREHTGFKDGDYSLPGGHVEADETFLQAACREVLEEVGLQVNPEDLEYKVTVHRKAESSIRIDVYFEITIWTGEPTNTEPERHAEIKWLSSDALPRNFADYMKFGLDCIKAGKTYGEFGWPE
jgi:8-oxo-dGTP diphosphatase